jgi:hypothetical protein
LKSAVLLTIFKMAPRPIRLLARKRRSEETEEVMNDVRFLEPVILKIPRGFPRKVASSFEALECLEQEWPEWARGRSWRAACRACRDALEGWRGARDARRAFVKAAERAGLETSGRRPVRMRVPSPAFRQPQGPAQQPSLSSAG